MGILQKGLNQALTGATFLLQQTSAWKEMSNERENLKNMIKSSEEAQNLSSYSTKQVKNIAGRKSKKTLDKFDSEEFQKYVQKLKSSLEQYREQEEQLRAFKGELKREDVAELKKMGISDEAIKNARYK